MGTSLKESLWTSHGVVAATNAKKVVASEILLIHTRLKAKFHYASWFASEYKRSD